ncbi:glycyl-tRNA synthetase, beta chain [Campylobacter blaseri]|uniref:Glycine--tRNA ligase beta subunit n=1 Tax=Campylobacter blaseri TaxID=2042961 RepID=A0A2P8R283_9BACT|nr:glycine--tRNA ligase subunit beta [Campylobacter blaseri]PSM52599.1 glycine--tRNA ligase subunit beta [Campylobacter blaseri]PSM54247.1 glycine--tRNA ligase subunit beta [Campylobacter blaseri]QKF85898.1 glycyl-tRNA synthetase, beta chain [Campylobacter blaseri]
MRLLIEIGVEELPAIPFLKELENIKPKFIKLLDENGLSCDFSFEYTPRRLVIFSQNFPEKQKNEEIQSYGAPKNIALVDGKWSRAAQSFAKKCGISEYELEFVQKDGKEVLYFQSIKKGKDSYLVLEGLIDEFLKSLNFGKSMRWGDTEYEFIRPIRSIACVLDDKNVDIKIFGISSKMAFYPHRNFGYELISFASIDEYFKKLPEFGVVLSKTKREEKILKEFEEIEKKSGLKIELDRDLLDEIVSITEHPTALLGEFDKEFLVLPKEVIITSMKENQRYFPVFKNDKLSNHFIVVSNSLSSDNNIIIKGNEKVLRARLSDAMFFWENDIKVGLKPESLKDIVYMKELGSVYEKELRESSIALKLADIYKDKFSKNINELLKRAIMLSKADLTTSMVGEFGELQGIIGSYYAKEQNEDESIVKAINEQYLPTGENSKLPTSLFSSIVSLSSKLDNIMGLFSIGKIPTGNKDPYALRRAANGVLKIAINENISFNLPQILEEISSNYAKFDLKTVENFILDRLNTIYDTNPSIINACLHSGQRDIKALNSAIIALDEIAKDSGFKEKFTTFKRVANIIKDQKISEVDERRFELDAEKKLYNEFKNLKLELTDYKEYLNSLFGLKDKIDNFFDKVMINVDDEKIKENRVALIGQIYKAFLKVADIKEISI